MKFNQQIHRKQLIVREIIMSLKMMIKWYALLYFLHVSYGLRTCPQECTCSMDVKGRLQVICAKGGLKTIPVKSLDPDVQVFIVLGPKNFITVTPVFLPFTKLEIVRINDANVHSLGVHSFWGVQSLRLLDFSRNNITFLLASHFRGQDGLHELNLSQNKIQELPQSVFHHLKDLRRLNLADNLINELVPRVFFMLGRLKYLDISKNPLNDLPPDVFKDILELKELRCRSCNLKKINPQVYNLLQRLDTLDIGDNQLKYLEKDEFRDLRYLRKIRLDGNQLSVIIDNLFEFQKNLEHLDLSRNRLAKVTNGAFINLSNLTYLDLSYNKLVKLESASMVPLIKLHALNISGNIQMDLYEIRETFQLLRHLKSLSIADMGPLPFELLVPLNHLKFLNLSGNHLVNISMQIIYPLDGLEVLDLSRNQLNGFEDNHTIILKKIKEVKLDKNPLVCDRCHLGSLISIAKKLKWSLHPVCFLPETLRGAKISQLNPSLLEWCTETEPLHDENLNAASTSHNFLMHGNINVLAFLGGIIFILVAVIIFITVICFASRGRNRRANSRNYTKEDRKHKDKIIGRDSGGNAGDLAFEMESSIDISPSVTGTELSFKYSKDDRVCTIEKLVIPTPPPPPSSKIPIND